jgi:hypothetical protein
MLTEKGTLPVGVEFDGKTHRDFEIREQLVRDMVEVYDDPELSARAEKNDAFMGLCLMARQVRIGTIPQEAITPELLLGMHQADMSAINKAEKVLVARRASFRGGEAE